MEHGHFERHFFFTEYDMLPHTPHVETLALVLNG